MKLENITYERPEFEQFTIVFKASLDQLQRANTFNDFDNIFLELYQQRDNYSTMFELANIRYTLDTNNPFYNEEVAFFNKISPEYESLIHEFYQVLNKTKFKREIEKKYGTHILTLSENLVGRFNTRIIEELKTENTLVSSHIKLKGTAEILFNGEKFNLAGMQKYLIDEDRTVRKEAHAQYWSFFEKKQNQLDDLYDQLVRNRHNMSVKMGHENFIELGYKRIGRVGRIGYDETMVDNFRKQIVKEIVPITQELRGRQKKRLGYEELMDYDLGFRFPNGNPKPKGTYDQLMEVTQKMYAELSPETEVFFNYMLENNLMDLKNRHGKKDNGYCWRISNYGHPFVFANFNGTERDISVLTHEAGHAFQYYKSRDYKIIEHREPSSESAEIHAMVMEMLTYPWMNLFFKEDTPKYLFSHVSKNVLLMPYATAIDHFQHIVYKNPDYTPNQRAEVWNTMEELYLPDYKTKSSNYLKSGRFWQRIMHIYEKPFYSIDYVLALVCAFQFWIRKDTEKEQTWEDYLFLCKNGGRMPFLNLIKEANIDSPFEDGVVGNIANKITNYLNSIDDSSF